MAICSEIKKKCITCNLFMNLLSDISDWGHQPLVDVLRNIGLKSWLYGPSAGRSIQKPPRANIPQYGLSYLGLVSSLLYGTLTLNLMAFKNQKYTAYDCLYGNSPYGKIPTKKVPIRTLRFTSRLPCHSIK